MDVPPPPGTPYSMHPGNDTPRFVVTRVLQEHPEYWVIELRGIFSPRLRVQAVILREVVRMQRAG
ncbi:hypothetical protein [Deinococcus aestuarii]|uniref:hypothetical protein n=1 Tax=Deinococcus aestuarii TaxID=2774531 RepID=UPI001C0C37F5|nr:hypothetical protein [Deinococcus aestuarii]